MVYPIPTATATASATLLTPPSVPIHFSSKFNGAVTPKQTQLNLSVKAPLNNKLTTSPYGVTDKLNGLASEFGSLSEPIDRVKRLLHYASLLPPLDRSERVRENRVAGCATEVWVVAHMDQGRKMRFKADSDSEISKGFCWCLVWMLDGAEPEEVLTVDLLGMNVGFNVLNARSRVNTWHNVFFAMQQATKDLILLSRC
ncbi:sufE-like protein 2, chloroplastic [Cicer arietinum]|uniref:SufE-like protein 2, chloroplastic n=1 Tax=Cicer arietinum TaxID=3827 RepID=A0A1S2YBI4_CICAR|nr:sufE-like protein 2, chloroplastic [Cicer arietinum]